MRGTIDGKEVALAWQVAGGRHYLMVGSALARALRVDAGSRVDVAFSIVSGDDVRVPPEIAEAVRQEPAWRRLWRALRPAEQRRLAHLVDSARTDEVRARRAVELFRGLESGIVPGPPRRR